MDTREFDLVSLNICVRIQLCHIFCLFVFLCKFRLITFVVKKIYSFGIFEFRLHEAKIVWDIFSKFSRSQGQTVIEGRVYCF